MTKWVYDFAEGSKDMRDLLGGKGANVAEMTRVLGPDRVPAGFTITTEACVQYMNADRSEPDGMAEQVAEALGRLQEMAGKRLGDRDDPLLVSVRSGARESMPGMLDTVLNLGLNDESVKGLVETTGNERFAWDSYRRFVQMFGNVSRGIAGERFEDAIKAAKDARNVTEDTDLDVEALKELTETFQGIYSEETGEDFPQDPQEQLRHAIRAVFDSWLGKRAIAYRRQNHIPDDWGTAVNVQQMVFGNKGDTSGSGVAFSRDEVTGAPESSGDFLPNAQGEDVVSGVRTPRDIAEMRDWMPEAHEQLMEILRRLEAHYKDMQDTEFTVEEGRLYMLQTRSAKRPAQAAVRFAVDAVSEALLDRAQALMTIDPDTLDALLHPTFDPKAQFDVLASGVNASPGAAKGEIVFTAADAVAAAEEGRDVILVRPFTDAEDVAGFHAARGILTSEGGKASHAALVARGMGRPAVVGAQALEIDLVAKTVSVNGTKLHEGDRIAIDGTKGQVTTDDVPLVEARVDANFEQVLEWADELRRLDVRTNADTPADAKRARELGAQGIGLCRTEHMFMAENRQPKMRAMIMADDRDSRRAALAELLPLQQEDFEGIFKAMAGLPVTIRLLDPPLHEFLPHAEDLAAAVERARLEDAHDLPRLERLLERVHEISEENPMLGTRGCRLGILYPEIYEMQVHAILRAAKAAEEPPHPEIMIPLVDYEHELEIMRDLVQAVGDEEGLEIGTDYTVGTMIELPRACFVADRIARFADFFSFGTNDLTQTTFGISRDDAASFLPDYQRAG
ncbi:MAG: pyruvate, phosphate dikinase, partial [Solirubrobacteraceae bacterium]